MYYAKQWSAPLLAVALGYDRLFNCFSLLCCATVCVFDIYRDILHPPIRPARFKFQFRIGKKPSPLTVPVMGCASQLDALFSELELGTDILPYSKWTNRCRWKIHLLALLLHWAPQRPHRSLDILSLSLSHFLSRSARYRLVLYHL